MNPDDKINNDSANNDVSNEQVEVVKKDQKIDWSKFEVIIRRRFFSLFNRRVICFVHGFTSSFESHKKVFDPLIKRRYKFFSFNLPGHGQSIFEFNENDFTLTNYVNLVVEFIKFHNLKNVILIGHSMGGAIATIVRSMIPERIKCLILEDPLNRGAITSKEFFKFFFRKSEEGKINLFHPIKSFRGAYKNDPNYKKLLQDMLSSKTMDIINDAYEKIGSCPTLLMFGENDHVINPEISIKYISNLATNLTVKIIPNAKHSPSKEQPEIFFSTVYKFIKNLNDKKIKKNR